MCISKILGFEKFLSYFYYQYLRLEKGASYEDICAKLKEAAEGPMKERSHFIFILNSFCIPNFFLLTDLKY